MNPADRSSDDDAYSADESDDIDIDRSSKSMTIQKCMEKFRTPDFIMEGEFVSIAKEFISAGGNWKEAVEVIADSYVAHAQSCNVMAQAALSVGVNAYSVRKMLEDELAELIIKKFSPSHTDSLLHKPQEFHQILTSITSSTYWHPLIMKLHEKFPECTVIDYCVKAILNTGELSAITPQVATSIHQYAVFVKSLIIVLEEFLKSSLHSDQSADALEKLAGIVCLREYGYFYVQTTLYHLITSEPTYSHVARFISYYLRKSRGMKDTVDVTISMYRIFYDYDCNLLESVHSMIRRKKPTAADIGLLYNTYNNAHAPSPELLCDPDCLDLLYDCVFRKDSYLNDEILQKAVFLISYAAVLNDDCRPFRLENDHQICSDELNYFSKLLTKMRSILVSSRGKHDLLLRLQDIFGQMKHVAVATGVFHWIRSLVMAEDFFKIHQEPLPTVFIILDEIVSLYSSLHEKVFELLTQLFNSDSIRQYGCDVRFQLERRRMIIDRMVHMFTYNYTLPVARFIRSKLNSSTADVSLFRYFLMEVLEVISPTYSANFIAAFAPIAQHPEIAHDEKLSEEQQQTLKQFLENVPLAVEENQQ
ncbi:Negative elongation factor D [Trichinella papuae]|uniref:Negative elongation factor D n=1 Tax=Trichinella papuae TaxID=268474 RepID=A0A0V1N9Z9_9BILA|nr:Negative elongation factor D [Trichinella papuae]